MKLEVVHSLWGADGEEFAGGLHEIEKPTGKFLKLVAAAEAVGAVRVTAETAEERAKMDAHIESQEESEKKLAKAVESGAWGEANLAQYELDVQQGAPTGSVG